MKLWVGTSGYSYKPWLGKFYPERLAAKEMLGYYASRLPAVEINNTFYRLPKESVLQAWAEKVPDEFRFVLKAPQKITHVKRLKDAEPEVGYLFHVATVLGPGLGAILFQLPPRLQKDLGRLRNFLSVLPKEWAVAFEFRHPSWFVPEVYALLREHEVALTIGDTPTRPFQSYEMTASWTFVRFHHGARGRRGNYSQAELRTWQRRIAQWRRRVEVYAYFNNDWEGFAIRNARWLQRQLEPETSPAAA